MDATSLPFGRVFRLRASRTIAAMLVMVLGVACSAGSSIRIPPYHYVSPPAKEAKGNRAALGASGVYKVAPTSQAFHLGTPDGQFTVLFPGKVVAPQPGEAYFAISIKPLDPNSLGPPPPGFRYDGNAYELIGTYRPSQAPARLTPTH